MKFWEKYWRLPVGVVGFALAAFGMSNLVQAEVVIKAAGAEVPDLMPMFVTPTAVADVLQRLEAGGVSYYYQRALSTYDVAFPIGYTLLLVALTRWRWLWVVPIVAGVSDLAVENPAVMGLLAGNAEWMSWFVAGHVVKWAALKASLMIAGLSAGVSIAKGIWRKRGTST